MSTFPLRAARSAASSVGPLAAASAVSAANSLLIALAYARLAGPTSFGTYQIALSATAIVSIVALSGTATAATRAAAQGRSAAWPLFLDRLPYCAAASLLQAAAAAGLWFLGSETLAAALVAAAVALPLYVGADVYPAQLIGQRRYGRYLLFQIVLQSTTALAVIAAVAGAPRHPWIAVGALAGWTGILQFAGLVSLRSSATLMADDRHYARRMTLANALGAVDERLDVLLAGALLGARDAGLVAVARTLPMLVRRLWQILYQPFFVRIAAVPPSHSLIIAERYRLLLVACLGGLSLATIPAAPYLIPALFGESFKEAVSLTQLFMLAAGLVSLARLHEIVLRAIGDVRALATLYTTLALTSMVCLPPLIALWGILGIGIEALVATIVYIVLATRLARNSVAAGLVEAEPLRGQKSDVAK